MPQYPNRQFLDFEQPIRELYEQIEENKRLAEKFKSGLQTIIQQLEDAIIEKRKRLPNASLPGKGSAEPPSRQALYIKVYR